MSTDRELKACPFEVPGQEHKVVEGWAGGYAIRCLRCNGTPGKAIAGAEGKTREEAVEAWNTRPLRPEGGVREVEAFEFMRKELGLSPRESLYDHEPLSLVRVVNILESYRLSLLPPQEGKGE